MNSSEESRIEISEIMLSEADFEPLNSGPCRLVVPISSTKIDDLVPSSPLTYRESCLAKIFEITIYESSPPNGTGQCRSVSGGDIDGLFWSLFAGDSEGSKDGQRFMGDYFIPRQLACKTAQEYGLGKPERTPINWFGVGTTELEIPVLNIAGDEKIDKWKQFVRSLPRALESTNLEQALGEKIFEASVKIDPQGATVYQGEGITVIFNPNSDEDIFYTNIWINRCIHIPTVAQSTGGSYSWEDGGYTHVMSPKGASGEYTLKILRSSGEEILKVDMQSAPVGATVYKGKGITVIVTGSGAAIDTSYTLIDSVNRCLYIREAANSSQGSYTWEDGDYTHGLFPEGGEGEYILSVYYNPFSANPFMAKDGSNQSIFEGLSERGDFQEALADAIQKAKQQLKTDLVTWKLNEISGENGGFVNVTLLKVSINASPPSETSKP